jgi:CHASE1-domain containing sensor protein
MLDLAVVALAVMVSTTLLLIAWTLGVTGVRRVLEARRRLLEARLAIAIIERRVWTDASLPRSTAGSGRTAGHGTRPEGEG